MYINVVDKFDERRYVLTLDISHAEFNRAVERDPMSKLIYTNLTGAPHEYVRMLAYIAEYTYRQDKNKGRAV
jgi:hypothetical protein